MGDLSQVSLKNNILVDFKKNEVKKRIIVRIQELELDITKYKHDIEYLTLVCNLIEHLVVKKDKLDKKSIVLEIFRDFGGCSDEELKLISSNIDFLSSNKAIKSVSYYKLFKCMVAEYFKKK